MTCTEIPQQLNMPLTSSADVDAAELVLEDNAVENKLVMVIFHILLFKLILGVKWNNSIDNVGDILRITNDVQ